VNTKFDAEHADPLIGTVIAGRYEILSFVGRGGMSVVYKARNRAVGSIVAIKMLKQDLLSDEELFARFCQEAKAVQMLTHPNIVTMHEFGVTLQGQPFMAMDFLEGETLAELLEKCDRVSVKRCLRIFIQVCEALSHAHAHNIIHRDIKPGNIMVMDTANSADVVKIFDFGFAKFLQRPGRRSQALTQVGDVLGTPLYMSPEQSSGKTLDSRSDIYSVGCVMYEAITGRAPLIGENVLDTMQKQINEKPQSLTAARPDLYIPGQLTTILFKTLEKDPQNRYQSMSDLKRDLEVTNLGLSGRVRGDGSLPGLSRMKPIPGNDNFSAQAKIGIIVALAFVASLCVALFAFMGKPDILPGQLPIPTSVTPCASTKTLVPAKVDSNFKVIFPSDPKKLLDLAKTLMCSGNLIDADKAAAKAISALKSNGKGASRDIGSAYALLGEIKLARQEYQKADGNLKKALAIQQRELTPTHPDVISTLNSLAKTAEGQGDFARADAYYKQALAVKASQ